MIKLALQKSSHLLLLDGVVFGVVHTIGHLTPTAFDQLSSPNFCVICPLSSFGTQEDSSVDSLTLLRDFEAD